MSVDLARGLRRSRWCLVLLVALGGAAAPQASAAIHTVTDCGDSNAPGQLRDRILNAAAGDTIVIRACTIALANGPLAIGQALTILGAGAGATIIDGAAASQVLTTSGAPVTIVGVTVRNGKASTSAGIYNGGTLTLIGSVVRDNQATGGTGGGIGNIGGELILIDSAVVANRAATDGGGIYGSGPQIVVINGTISGNSAAGGSGGGGIYHSVGVLTLINTTIADNSASFGGGLLNAGPATARNTIFADNTATTTGPNCANALTSAGHNLERGTSCGLNPGLGDLVDVDPRLGPLQDNGGPTPTHALRAGSPALDAGDAVGCPGTDQRGVSRPQGAGCDIGAFEARRLQDRVGARVLGGRPAD